MPLTLGGAKLQQSVVPYFDTYMPCIKLDQYVIWHQALFLVLSKKHLTRSGLNEIKQLKDQLTALKKPLSSRMR